MEQHLFDPSDPILTTQPQEDVGAETHSRYRFQWECTARYCITMLVEDNIDVVLCEWHEDIVVFYRDGTAELISIKHREPTQGPWGLRELVIDGGVRHLFLRWTSTGRRARCLVVTNGALKPGADQAHGFAQACHQQDPGRLRVFAESIKLWLLQGADQQHDTADIVSFLLMRECRV